MKHFIIVLLFLHPKTDWKKLVRESGEKVKMNFDVRLVDSATYKLIMK